MTAMRFSYSLLVTVAALAVTVGMASPAAADEAVPGDVVAAYSDRAIDALRVSGDDSVDVDKSEVPDFSAASRFGEPHQVFLWSSASIAGDSAATAVEPLEEWVAPILTEHGDVLGTYRVWRERPKSAAELAGFDNDIELARALESLSAGAILVSDPPSGAWLSLEDGIVSPLNDLATVEVPYPSPVEEVTALVAKRYAAAIAQAGGESDSMGGGAPLTDRRPWHYGIEAWVVVGGITVAAAGAALAGLVLVGKRRRRAGG